MYLSYNKNGLINTYVAVAGFQKITARFVVERAYSFTPATLFTAVITPEMSDMKFKQSDQHPVKRSGI